MMKRFMIPCVILVALLVPALASATHLTSWIGYGDCQGWTADASIHFRTGIDEAQLDYVVALLDVDGNQLETHEWAGTVSRDSTGNRDITVHFAGEWQGYFESSSFTATMEVHINAPYPGGVDDESMSTTVELACTVADEAASWGAVKSLYR